MAVKVDGEKLREAREDALLSQRELGEKAGVSPDTILRMEAGKGEVYGRTIRRIVKVLNIDYRKLLEEIDPEKDSRPLDNPGSQEKYPRWCSFCAMIVEDADIVMEVSLVGEGIKAISEPAIICTQCVGECVHIIEMRKGRAGVKRFVQALNETQQKGR